MKNMFKALFDSQHRISWRRLAVFTYTGAEFAVLSIFTTKNSPDALPVTESEALELADGSNTKRPARTF